MPLSTATPAVAVAEVPEAMGAPAHLLEVEAEVERLVRVEMRTIASILKLVAQVGCFAVVKVETVATMVMMAVQLRAPAAVVAAGVSQ